MVSDKILSGNESEIEKAKQDLNDVMEDIASLIADKNEKTIKDFMKANDGGIEGNFQLKTWLMKKKLCPKNCIDPPAAMKDSEGNLVTSKAALENLYLKTYQDHLTPNKTEEGYEDLKDLPD